MPSEDPNDQYEELLPKPLPPPHGRLGVQLLLFALTLATTTMVGAENYAFFTIDYAQLASLIKRDDGALTALDLAALVTARRTVVQPHHPWHSGLP